MKNSNKGNHSITIELSPKQFQAIERASRTMHLTPARLILSSAYISWGTCYGGGLEDLASLIGNTLADIDAGRAPEIFTDPEHPIEELGVMRHP